MESVELVMENSADGEEQEMQEEQLGGEIMADYQAHQALKLEYQADLEETYLAWKHLQYLDDLETEGVGVGAS